MYRILVVDDEPYIVDSISAILKDMEEPELDVYPAYSAFEALDILEQRKFDIVLSDIQMPGMDGLEMQRRINRLWPRCKLIFLTGYDHFEYVQCAIKQGAANYILKTDGNEEVKAALRKAVHQIEHELENNEILNRAKQQLSLAIPMLKKDLLTLLSREEYSLAYRQRRFEELELKLSPEEPLIYIAGQVDDWKEELCQSDRALLLYAVGNIAEELLGDEVRFESTVYDDTRFAWFLQAREEMNSARFGLFVEENLDAIQRNCRNLLNLNISVALHREPVEWDELPGIVADLQRLLFRGAGLKQEMILYLESEAGEHEDQNRWKIRREFNQFSNIVKHFEAGDSHRFCSSSRNGSTAFTIGMTACLWKLTIRQRRFSFPI